GGAKGGRGDARRRHEQKIPKRPARFFALTVHAGVIGGRTSLRFPAVPLPIGDWPVDGTFAAVPRNNAMTPTRSRGGSRWLRSGRPLLRPYPRTGSSPGSARPRSWR